MVRVDLRTITLNVPPQEVITKDNVPVRVNAVAYFRIVEPKNAIVQVENYMVATSQIAQTTLRSVLGQRARVPRHGDHHLLPLEGRVEVRHDAHPPRVADGERLGRRPVLAARAERARLELLRRLGLEMGHADARPARTPGRDDCQAARQRVAAEVYFSPSVRGSTNAFRMSIGAGKTIVDEFVAPISSSVCR
jgi:hypothetical protein